MIEKLERCGFAPLDDSRLQKVPQPLRASLKVRNVPSATEDRALDYLKLLLCPQETMLANMTVVLSKHKRPARRRAVEQDEFWICFGKWLLQQICYSEQGKKLTHMEKEAAKRTIDGHVTVDRYETLLAAFCLNESASGEAFLHQRRQLQNLVKPGTILVIDETILGSNSKAAKREGMIRYVPGKPHPKGYFINMGLQKLCHSSIPIVWDVECKWSYSSLSMKHALLAIVHRLEDQLASSFVVLADSGYPASSIIGHPRKDLKSKFICSLSTAKVSGSLRYIAEAATECLPLNRKSLIWNESEGLVAYCNAMSTYTQVLVTNACAVTEATPPADVPFPMSFDQAQSLALQFSVEEMVRLFQWPAPSPKETVGHDRYPFQYLLKLTGQDICCPLDSDGFVSEDSLKFLSIDAIRGIAEYCKVKHTGVKKKDLIESILKRHPKAKHPRVPTPAQCQTRDTQAHNANAKSSEHLERDSNIFIDQFMRPTTEPDFASVYRANYGLEDRFNTVLYANFAHHRCRNHLGKYTWFYFYVCLWNSYALWKEFREKTNQNSSCSDGLTGFSRFLLLIVCQIGEQYGKQNESS